MAYPPLLTLPISLPEKYLSELLAERHKLSPFVPVIPHTYRLLNQGEFDISTTPYLERPSERSEGTGEDKYRWEIAMVHTQYLPFLSLSWNSWAWYRLSFLAPICAAPSEFPLATRWHHRKQWKALEHKVTVEVRMLIDMCCESQFIWRLYLDEDISTTRAESAGKYGRVRADRHTGQE
ncbi:hypothetical protein V6N11_052105 [Hibiscus sabdariffa]|uniref:Uncharacterized protein n=1 Tax=Hibiscus sabdariffa TaxID=183260 RepID=A0ABR2U9K7_9ROSI